MRQLIQTGLETKSRNMVDAIMAMEGGDDESAPVRKRNAKQPSKSPNVVSDQTWQCLFMLALHKHRDLRGAEFSRMIDIPTQYIKRYTEAVSPLNFSTRLWTLDILGIDWNFENMLLALGDEDGSRILEYMRLSFRENFYHISGNYSDSNYLLRQIINFVMKEKGVRYHNEFAQKLEVQPTTFCSYRSGGADIRLDQKIKILEMASLKINSGTLDVIVPHRIKSVFSKMPEQYERFLTAFLESRDIGPKLPVDPEKAKMPKLGIKHIVRR